MLCDSHHLHRHYALPGHLQVVQRGPNAVQIGVDAPSRVVLRGAPAHAAQVLRSLTGHRPLGEVLTPYTVESSDVAVWVDLVGELTALGLLVEVAAAPADHPSTPEDGRAPSGLRVSESPELSSLTARLGPAVARRVLRSRADARVVLLGPEPLIGTLRAALVAAGVGSVQAERGADSAGVRRGRPVSTDLVVLGAVDVLDLGLAAALTRDRTPHLGVVAGSSRVVVGPLVLPGRSSCLACAYRHRVDADPEWPVVLQSLVRRRPPSPSAMAVTMAGAVAAAQILDHLDGLVCPGTVDGTVEWHIGEATPRRRTWASHPTCGCRDLAGRPPGAGSWTAGDRRSADAVGATVTMER